MRKNLEWTKRRNRKERQKIRRKIKNCQIRKKEKRVSTEKVKDKLKDEERETIAKGIQKENEKEKKYIGVEVQQYGGERRYSNRKQSS